MNFLDRFCCFSVFPFHIYLVLSDFGGHASDYFHSYQKQEQREGYQGKQTDEQSGYYRPQDIEDFHSGSHCARWLTMFVITSETNGFAYRIAL